MIGRERLWIVDAGMTQTSPFDFGDATLYTGANQGEPA